MSGLGDIEVIVFDVLGTLVDEPGGLRAEIHAAVPAGAGDLLTVWQGHVDAEQRRIAQGARPYAPSDVLDREAAHRVAEEAGITDPATISHLATASRRLPAWPDSVAGLDRLARCFPVIGLSNASRTTLLHLTAHTGLRFHQALSAEPVQAYKPAPEVYRHAIETAACPPGHILMIAAHAWDLRAAQRSGMRTAYVPRPSGDAPAATDAFGGQFADLGELAAALA